MLKKNVRSRNVNENKQSSDTMPGKKSDIYVLDSDIYVYPNAILQKTAAFGRQFVRSIRFFAGFLVHYKAHLRIMSPHNLRCSAGFQSGIGIVASRGLVISSLLVNPPAEEMAT